MRFELVDRIIEQDETRLVAVKAVTAAEEYLADHFPGFPILPGVMMLEALVHAGRALVESTPAGQAAAADRPLVLQEVRNVRYGNMVRPGQTLRVEVTLKKAADGVFDLQGIGHVDEQVAVQGKFTLAALPTD